MDIKRKKERLAQIRRNMINKMGAGLDYSYEEREISKLVPEIAEFERAVAARNRKNLDG